MYLGLEMQMCFEPSLSLLPRDVVFDVSWALYDVVTIFFHCSILVTIVPLQLSFSL